MKKLLSLALALLLAVPSAFAQWSLPNFDGAKDAGPVQVLPAPKVPEPQAPSTGLSDLPPEIEAALAELGFSGEDMAQIWAVSALIRQNYVDEVEKKKLLYGAIRGMTKELDPHSTFFTPEEYAAFKRSLSGTYAGVGILMKDKEAGKPVGVQRAFPNSPAAAAGIKSGDEVLEVDGVSTNGLTQDEARKKITGTPGTKVRLKIKSGAVVKDIDLVRTSVQIPDVYSKMLKNGIGYVQVSQFGPDTPAKFYQHLQYLKKQGMKSLVIDLRDNPGGSLASVIKMTAGFLKKDRLIVSAKGRGAGGQQMSAKTGTDGDFKDLPLAVLVNGGSASASEIMAGAIQDHKRGTVIGRKTYGKGTVQTFFDLPDGSTIKMTIQRYYTPSGKSVDKNGGTGGITPDVTVAVDEKVEEELSGRLYRQLMGEQVTGTDADLDAAMNALSGGKGAAAK